jgi:hypothetical protein
VEELEEQNLSTPTSRQELWAEEGRNLADSLIQFEIAAQSKLPDATGTTTPYVTDDSLTTTPLNSSEHTE